MNFYRRFPYTNLNDINLDWIIKKIKALIGVVDEKQDKPATTGTAGQVLGLDENLNPVWLDQTGGGGGTTNYNNLANKPKIEGVTLSGNKTAADLGLAKASDIPAVPVQSVNGKTGAVVLDASDVGALPSSTAIPSKTSDLTNDSGFVNASEAAAAAPVQSVNGLSGGDVNIAIPSASSALPQMDGVASAGSNFSQFARGDHVHPSDISRASTEVVAIVQNTNIATRNIPRQKYVIWNGSLYLSTATIAAGATLSSSNLTAVSDGGLNALQNAVNGFTQSEGIDMHLDRTLTITHDSYSMFLLFGFAATAPIMAQIMGGPDNTSSQIYSGSSEIKITHSGNNQFTIEFSHDWGQVVIISRGAFSWAKSN